MPETIEAEVLEIDGGPPPQAQASPGGGPRGPWESMRGKMIRLDRRWWPLWLLLGLLFGLLFVAIGLVVGVAWFLGRLIRRFLGIFVAAPARPGGGLARRDG